MSEIKVKALEWEPGGGDGKMSQRATVIGLRYYVYKNDEDGIWRSYTEGYQMASFGEFFTEEGAKAAAQSDFDARIRSALVERKAEPGDGVRDAAARHCGLVRAAHGGPFRKLPDIFDAFIAGANWRADAALSDSPSPVDSRERIERLVKALEPFAQAASVLRTVERTTGREFKDEDAFQSGLAWNNDGIVTTITYGHLRAARLALSAKEHQL